MKKIAIIFLISFYNLTVMAQKKIDLSTIKFTENAEQVLKGIPSEKINGDNGVVKYLADPKSFNYQGAPMDASVRINAWHNEITSYMAKTNFTKSTNLLLKALIAKYHQPTKKLTDNGDTRAYYWETPEVFIRFMSGESFHNGVRQNFSFVNIVTQKGLKANVEPDMLDIYKVQFAK